MYVSNGYVCASQPSPSPSVQDARIVDDLYMLVTFDTGETRILDAADLVQFEAFAPLADQEIFSRYSIDHGVLTWLDGDIDIAPEGLYRRTHALG